MEKSIKNKYKAFTSLEQSKKLAEILPLGSADMWYEDNGLIIPRLGHIPKEHTNTEVSCWSLVALLDILPSYLFEFERGIDLNIYPNLNSKGWHCSYMPNCIENMKTDRFRLITSEDTLVDACYEMILKLHELNLL